MLRPQDVRTATSALIMLGWVSLGACAGSDRVRLTGSAAHDFEKFRRELRHVASRTNDHGVVFTVPDELFEPGKAELTADGHRELTALAVYLQAHPEQRAAIQTGGGAVDAPGRRLARRRGTVVETFFLKRGIDPEQLAHADAIDRGR